MNKEVEDALHMLLHCSLKDTEYETQFEQYKIVRNYIINLRQENKQLKERFERLKQEHIDTITRNEEKQQRIDKAIEYIKTTDRWLCRVNDNLCVEAIGKDKLLEILGDKE